MKEKSLHSSLMEAMRDKIPNNSQLANRLMDILYIGKEAVYRRLRGEVHFSLQEASIISEKMGISLDGLTGVISSRSRPFSFKMTKYADPEEIDYHMANEFVYFLKDIEKEPATEMGVAAKMFHDTLHLKYKYITRFYLFKWMYQYDNLTVVKKFENIAGTTRILDILAQMREAYLHIKNTYYILDRQIFQNLVDDIKYFEIIGLIDKKGVELLKNDLISLANDLEAMAAKGVNEIGNKVYIYISNINFEAGFSYIESQKYKLSLVRAFTLYDISSMDHFTLENSMKWMQSLKRASTLISESGEIQRMNFFKVQREIINTL